MSTYVWMRLLERAADRYDTGIRLLSLGRIQRVYDHVAELARGPEVLDLGCGTGAVALRLARRGMRVTGVDESADMLAVARRKGPSKTGIRWTEAGAVELIDHFRPESFDTITSVLLFSELSEAEQMETLRQCHRLLRSSGQLIIADEVRAPTPGRRTFQYLVRLPLAAVTYLLTQTSTSAVQDLEKRIAASGFSIVNRESHALGSFSIIEAEGKEGSNAPHA